MDLLLIFIWSQGLEIYRIERNLQKILFIER